MATEKCQPRLSSEVHVHTHIFACSPHTGTSHTRVNTQAYSIMGPLPPHLYTPHLDAGFAFSVLQNWDELQREFQREPMTFKAQHSQPWVSNLTPQVSSWVVSYGTFYIQNDSIVPSTEKTNWENHSMNLAKSLPTGLHDDMTVPHLHWSCVQIQMQLRYNKWDEHWQTISHAFTLSPGVAHEEWGSGFLSMDGWENTRGLGWSLSYLFLIPVPLWAAFPVSEPQRHGLSPWT